VRLTFSKLSHYQSNRLLEHLVAGVPARTAAELVDINCRTAIHFYHRLRTIIARPIEEEGAFSGAMKVDESYFGGRRKGKRERGAAGKVPVFGILQCGGKVYTKVLAEAKAQTLLLIIHDKIVPASIVYTDYYRSSNALGDVRVQALSN